MKPPTQYGAGIPTEAEATLAAWDLGNGLGVEVELLGEPMGRVLEGRIVDATGNVLVLEGKGHGRRTRVPWHAIALVRAALAEHPAT